MNVDTIRRHVSLKRVFRLSVSLQSSKVSLCVYCTCVGICVCVSLSDFSFTIVDLVISGST